MGSQASPLGAVETVTHAPRAESVRTVLDALRRIVRELRLTGRDAERSEGISAAQLFVLQTLAEARAASLSDLAERTLTDQSSVSVVVRRLADRKLIARKKSRDDARRVELSLTAAGRRLLARCPEPTQVRLVAALRRVHAGELAGLADGLGALIREMGIESGSARMFFEDESEGVESRRGRCLSTVVTGGTP